MTKLNGKGMIFFEVGTYEGKVEGDIEALLVIQEILTRQGFIYDEVIEAYTYSKKQKE